MPLKKIQTTLTNAPAAAKWWSVNKESVTKTWKVWEKWINISIFSSFAAFIVSGMFSGAYVFGFTDDQHTGFVAFCIFMLLAGGFVWLESRKLKVLAKKYKQGVDEFGFDPNIFRKDFSEDMRKKLVSNLRGIGIDPVHIVALRHLDVPNSWWHHLNNEVDHHLKTTEVPTLDQVYTEVERDIVPRDHSKFLRL